MAKAKHVQTLALISSLLLLMLTNCKVVHSSQDVGDRTTFVYTSFNPKPADLIYEGDASVIPGKPFLRLTRSDPVFCNAVTNSYGRVVYSKPVKLWEAVPRRREASFETIMFFNITPPITSALPFESFDFIIGVFRNDHSVGAGKLRIFDSTSSTSSIFDVVSSDGDPNDRYIRIRPRILKSSTSSEDKYFNVMRGQSAYASIAYDAPTATIYFLATADGRFYADNYVLNLTSFLPQQIQVGIWASTVKEVAVHDLQEWFFNSTLA